jgi:hypothetical protein
VFYDLTLGYESLFSDFLGIELIIDFCPVVAREKLIILNDGGFHLENDIFYYGVVRLKTRVETKWSMWKYFPSSLLYAL